jgi:hypothetical protein
MPLNFPDILKHNNPNNALVDSDSIRGGTRSPVQTLQDLYLIGQNDVNKAGSEAYLGKFKQHATRIYVSGEGKFYVLKDFENRGLAAGWEVDGGGSVDTSNFYPKNNPSGFITSGSLTGFATSGDLSGYYPNNNPSGFITSGSLTGFATSGDLSGYYPNNNPSGFITGYDTGLFYPSSNPSGFITEDQLVGLGIGNLIFENLSDLNTYASNADQPFGQVCSVLDPASVYMIKADRALLLVSCCNLSCEFGIIEAIKECDDCLIGILEAIKTCDNCLIAGLSAKCFDLLPTPTPTTTATPTPTTTATPAPTTTATPAPTTTATPLRLNAIFSYIPNKGGQFPTPTPTPTPTATPSLTPTQELDFEGVEVNVVCEIINTPTPTPTPTPTLTPTSPPNSNLPFIMKIKTNNSGQSSSNEFILPLSSAENYNFDIAWGDGTVTETYSGQFSSISHTYQQEGEYFISIKANEQYGFPRVIFNNGGDRLKVIELVKWGEGRWKNFHSAFYGCANMTISANDILLGDVEFFTSAWRGCSSITSFPSINTSSGINFSAAWRDCSSMTSFGNINVQNGQTFNGTWRGCSLINSFPALNMSSMSNGTSCFNGVTLPTSTYSSILNNLAQNNTNINVTLDAGANSKYSSAAQASKDILSNNGWNITDGGLA